jgi:multicomponent Na+:H+ antiporter subunit D
VLAVLFLLAALSLAGIPPLSGFWAKLAVLRASALAAQWWVLGVALAAGLLTLLSMLKIWIEVFWKPAPAPVADAAIMDTTDPAAAAAVSAVPRASDPGRADGAVTPASPAAMWASTAALVLLVTLLGVAPGPLLDLADGAAAALLRPDLYVQAVSP